MVNLFVKVVSTAVSIAVIFYTTNSNSENSELTSRLRSCCTSTSYVYGPYSLRVKNPVGIDINRCGGNISHETQASRQSFLDGVNKATGIKFIRDPNYSDASLKLSARISVIEIPSDRRKLERSCSDAINSGLHFISNIVTNDDGEAGIMGIIDKAYSRNAYAIAHVRGTKGDNTVYDVLVVKPATDEFSDNLIYRSVLEAIGYNADNLYLSDSIFSDTSRVELTENDIAALQDLYRNDSEK